VCLCPRCLFIAVASGPGSPSHCRCSHPGAQRQACAGRRQPASRTISATHHGGPGLGARARAVGHWRAAGCCFNGGPCSTGTRLRGAAQEAPPIPRTSSLSVEGTEGRSKRLRMSESAERERAVWERLAEHKPGSAAPAGPSDADRHLQSVPETRVPDARSPTSGTQQEGAGNVGGSPTSWARSLFNPLPADTPSSFLWKSDQAAASHTLVAPSSPTNGLQPVRKSPARSSEDKAASEDRQASPRKALKDGSFSGSWAGALTSLNTL